jgi:hypothetical protein
MKKEIKEPKSHESKKNPPKTKSFWRVLNSTSGFIQRCKLHLNS